MRRFTWPEESHNSTVRVSIHAAATVPKAGLEPAKPLVLSERGRHSRHLGIKVDILRWSLLLFTIVFLDAVE